MTKKEIIKEIDELCEHNRKYTRETNEALNRLRGSISTAAYEQGTRDAWELARKITGFPSEGGLTLVDMNDIFGTTCSSKILKENTYEQALAKIEEYGKRKTKKEQELKCGDVVVCEAVSNSKINIRGIYLHSVDDAHVIIESQLKQITTINIGKSSWALIKTGEYIDIQPLLAILKYEG